MSYIKAKVDIVIPVAGSLTPVYSLLREIALGSCFIRRVYLVRSFGSAIDSTKALEFTRSSLVKAGSISRKDSIIYGLEVSLLEVSLKLYPGAARNVGVIFSDSEYVAFLDSNTIPSRSWIADLEKVIRNSGEERPILGSTIYLSDTYVKKVIIAATYGFLPITTLPGSVIHRCDMSTVGLMMPNWRAAEDIDFMLRLKALFPSYSVSMAPCQYLLASGNILYYFLKWLRNYSESAPYQKLATQAQALALIGLFALILSALHWNGAVAGWDESSRLYVANIAKLALLMLSTVYLSARGIYLPYKKGAFSAGKCRIIDVIPILGVSILLDVAKALAMLIRPLHLYSLYGRVFRDSQRSEPSSRC